MSGTISSTGAEEATHGVAAAAIALVVSAISRLGHNTCSVDISSVNQRLGSGVARVIALPPQSAGIIQIWVERP